MKNSRNEVDAGPAGQVGPHRVFAAVGKRRRCDMPRRRQRQNERRRQPAGQPRRQIEDRQQLNEPHRAERLDETLEIGRREGRRGRQPQLAGFDAKRDQQPQRVEVSEVDHLAIEKFPPWPLDRPAGEQPRHQEEVGHAKRLGEGDDLVQPAAVADRHSDPEGRMHGDHQHDRPALGVVDPGDAAGRAVGGGAVRTGPSRRRDGFGQCRRVPL